MHRRELVSMLAAADVALHELVGDVVVLGQQLAGHVERHRVRAVLADAVAECRGDRRRCASSQLTRSPRTCGCSRRSSRPTVSPSAVPFTHSLPRLAGCAGSPRTLTSPPSCAAREHAAAHAAVGTGSSGRSAGVQALGSGRRVEQQLVAYRTDVRLVGDQVAQARGLAHVAEQHGAADLVALEHHALVDAAALVREHQ